MRFAVGSDQNWRWRVTLPRYDADGNVIKWTIDEEYVPGYEKIIDGYNITNRHVSVNDPNWRPGGRPPGGDRNIPQTGDERALWLWVGIAILNLGGLVIIVILGIKGRHKRGNFGI